LRTHLSCECPECGESSIERSDAGSQCETKTTLPTMTRP
jgi:predicted RNA-binding Zn-ribbon protein involved in translation (DUF1610 family)